MKKLIGLILLFFTSTILNSQILLIKNTNIVDVRTGAIRSNVSVLIHNNRIQRIEKEIRIADNVQVFDGTGKYLIPGLWDMHTHTWDAESTFPLLTANGVTGIRDMFGSMSAINKWKEDIANGRLKGPVIYGSGPIVDGPKPIWPGSVAISSPKQIHDVIDSLKNKLKVDFIKVYSLIPRADYFSIVDETRKHSISFAGHVPAEVTVLEAAKAGQKSQEHLIGFVQGSSDSAEYFNKVSQKQIIDTPLRNPVIKMRRLLNTFNEKNLSALVKELAKYENVWICPTLTVNHNLGYLADSVFTNDPRVHYMMPGIKNFWDPKNDFRFKNYAEEYYDLSRKTFALHLKIVKQLQDAGVKMIAGTDYPNPYCFPGFSLHDELSYMVEAGLTPLQALQTATINPALYFNITNDYGTVEVGKVANLVLLEQNPLVKIDHTKSIFAVVINGKYLSKAELEGMLKKLWR